METTACCHGNCWWLSWKPLLVFWPCLLSSLHLLTFASFSGLHFYLQYKPKSLHYCCELTRSGLIGFIGYGKQCFDVLSKQGTMSHGQTRFQVCCGHEKTGFLYSNKARFLKSMKTWVLKIWEYWLLDIISVLLTERSWEVVLLPHGYMYCMLLQAYQPSFIFAFFGPKFGGILHYLINKNVVTVFLTLSVQKLSSAHIHLKLSEALTVLKVNKLLTLNHRSTQCHSWSGLVLSGHASWSIAVWNFFSSIPSSLQTENDVDMKTLVEGLQSSLEAAT